MSEHYDDNFAAFLEEMWGEGYMSPGGPEEVARVLDGLDLNGKRVMDIGCGTGAIALSLHRQQGALEMQKTVTETTNQLLKENAEMLKDGAFEIEKANQEGLVSIETLKHVNQSLVDTINEVRQIQEQGRRDRAQAEQDLKRIEGELREALVA